MELQWAANSSSRMKLDARADRGGSARGRHGVRGANGRGDAAEVLVRLATESGADLLVIGNKGMKRRVLGSVPNWVTHKAECSVLVVKTT